jgi:hypothetical protein
LKAAERALLVGRGIAREKKQQSHRLVHRMGVLAF